MSGKGELFDKWKQFGRVPGAGAGPAEEKKAPPQYNPPVSPPKAVQIPIATGPIQNAAYIETLKKKQAEQSAIPQPHTEEMKMTMKAQTGQIPIPAPKEKKPNATDEMKMIMQSKTALAPASPPKEQKVSVGTKEMLNTMQNRPVYPPPKPAQEPVKKTNYLNEMETTFKSKVTAPIMQSTASPPKRKTATEEMLETMKARQAVQAEKPAEKPKLVAQVITPVIAQPVFPRAEAAEPKVEIPVAKVEKIVAAKIEQDADMNEIRKTIEEKVKFDSGDTMEMKKRIEPEIAINLVVPQNVEPVQPVEVPQNQNNEVPVVPPPEELKPAVDAAPIEEPKQPVDIIPSPIENYQPQNEEPKPEINNQPEINNNPPVDNIQPEANVLPEIGIQIAAPAAQENEIQNPLPVQPLEENQQPAPGPVEEEKNIPKQPEPEQEEKREENQQPQQPEIQAQAEEDPYERRKKLLEDGQ